MGKKYRVGCKGLDESGKGKVIFNNKPFAVPYFLPGEKGEIELVFQAKETTARLISLDETSRSADRVETGCGTYEACGGCQLLHMRYEAQLAWKQKLVEELFPEEKQQGVIAPVIAMEQPWNYRHKVYCSFANGKKKELLAGIYEENSHRIVKIENCRIQHPLANEIIAAITAIMKKKGIPAYNEDRNQGVLRHVYIRVGEKTGQVMVVLVTGTREFKEKNLFVEELRRRFPQITTIIHNINSVKTSMVLGKKETVLYGPGTIEDELCGLRFEISSQSFYQINPVQTEKLYETAVEFAGLTGKETVLDAYCGIGTISMVTAKKAKEVIGVELNETACMDARKNAKKNNCQNVRFVAADAGNYMAALAKEKGAQKPEVVFMDPPRSGSDARFLQSMVQMAPKKIVYISCNPVTQKMDIDVLKKKGYRVEKMQAVDCFCHTHHVETVVLLSRKAD
ncbi:MAG: 23S rRNA (uracil(1939)-C(5))-methyltransferase RlmD [Lachnospiraceae bacterium]|nr:23S rRNA (uracil(1939)-C(5))-methyltransferase RlmD [Lachnospiraceae bacterium]